MLHPSHICLVGGPRGAESIYKSFLSSIEGWEASSSFGHSQREVRCQTHIVFENCRARPSLIPFIDSSCEWGSGANRLTLHRGVALLRIAARYCEILAKVTQIQHLSRNIWWDTLRPTSMYLCFRLGLHFAVLAWLGLSWAEYSQACRDAAFFQFCDAFYYHICFVSFLLRKRWAPPKPHLSLIVCW